MEADDRAAVAAAVRGRVRADVPLAPLCTYRVGGPAALLVEPADVADLQALLPILHARGLPTLILGGGSNLLVADAGFPGVVLRLRASEFELIDEAAIPGRVRLGGGVRMSRLMGRAAARGWARLAFLEGIPGTVGGCVRMNAGTRDGQTEDVVVDVDFVTPGGDLRTLAAADCGFAYRRSELPPGAVVVAATVDPGQGEPAAVKAALKAHHDHRRATQPTGPSAGSVFANPPGDHAGRLIEAAGLKGRTLGCARISERHANWIVTSPGATAADVHGLLTLARDEVARRFGVVLRTENVLVGFAP